MIMEILDAFGIPTAGAPDCEADDVLGTLAEPRAHGSRRRRQRRPRSAAAGPRQAGAGPGAVSRPRPGEGDEVGSRRGRRATTAFRVDRAGPAYAELALLRGDPSDGLPGVPGVGEKTAATLLAQHGSLEDILAAAHDPKSKMSKAYRTKLLAATDYIEAAEPVVKVAIDADVNFSTPVRRCCRWPPSTRARWPSSPSNTASRRRLAGCRRHLTRCPATSFARSRRSSSRYFGRPTS